MAPMILSPRRGAIAHRLRWWASILCLICVQSASFSRGFGQVPPAITPATGAGNLGTTVTHAGDIYHITGGTRPGNGSNLFHSFGEFGVPTNNIANFLNDSGLATSNILGRVTGGHPSNIFGAIQTTGFGNANLFLMNPAGIVFGPNAALNVGGTATFTTADYLRSADGARFNAIPGPQDASISSAPVAAFGFLGANPGAITVEGGQLSVAPGRSLSLVGGDITVHGVAVEDGTVPPVQLSAPGGSIHLASAASAGEFLTGTLDQAPNINGQSFGALGTIQVAQKSVIDASGDGGGTIIIRGGRFLIDDSKIFANTTGPAAGRSVGPPGTGIDIQVIQDAVIQNGTALETNVATTAAPGIGSGGARIKADRIELSGIPDFETFPFTGIRSNVAAESTAGNAGDITLEANAISLKDLATVQSSTEGAGNAGNILARATNNIEIDGSSIESTSGSLSSDTPASPIGNAGNIELASASGNILLTNGGGVFSQTTGGSGNTGKIVASAPQGDIILDGSVLFTQTRGTGGAGEIQFTARNLEVRGFSAISDDNLGLVKPGGVSIALSDELTVAGDSVIATASLSPTGAPAADLHIEAKDILVTENGFISSGTFRSGPGGRLTMITDTLQVTEGGQVRSGSTFAPFGTPPVPTGPGGDVMIQASAGPTGSVVIDGQGSGIFTDTQGMGSGGNLNLIARSLTVQNDGTISASTTGTVPNATGGGIVISAGQVVSVNNGGSITASSSGPANAGDITINAGSQFLTQNGFVTTQASQASGGNVTVRATDSIRLINSQVNTSVQGGPTTAGGNIILDPAVVTLQNSQVLAQAVQGQGGNINIIAGTFLADQTSLVSASSQFGLSGTVNIQSPLSNLSGTLATLPQRPLQVQHLLSQRCAAQASGNLSSLVMTGRDTLPAEPGGWLLSPLAWTPDEMPTQQARMTMSDSSRALRQIRAPTGPLGDQSGSWPQLGIAGCGS